MAKKTTIRLRNPFVYQGYVSPNYFFAVWLNRLY